MKQSFDDAETNKGKDTLTIQLSTAQDDGRPFYIAGNFNDWNASDENFRLKKSTNGCFEITFEDFQDLPEILEYKYTRGNWECTELDPNGSEVQNRVLKIEAGITRDTAFGWKKRGVAHNEAYRPCIETISETFEIPQLIKTRRITALLPYNYYETDKRYPVLYLQDGQNLFDDYAPFGSWGLDKRLAFMAENNFPEFIVVAIDHAKSERIKEFTPSTRTKLGIGDGQKYANFLAETLKPYVDSHFRTLPGKEHTGIGGSSMGGLISIYAAKQHPDLYSRLMIFSPSFWVTPDLPRRFIYHTKDFNGKIYLYGGGMEGSNMIFYLNNFKEIIDNDPHKRNIELFMDINYKGTHTESEWGNVFPKAAKWLFSDDES